MNVSKHLAQRTNLIHAGRQTSVAIPGLINMGSGTPDFTPPDHVFEAMQDAITKRKIQYTLWAGIPELRQAIATKLERQNHYNIDPELEVIVTSGAQEALVTVLMSFLDTGENVLTPSPHYGVYSEVALMMGAELIPVETSLESNFTVDVEALAAAITSKTKALIIVTPNNPTGTVIPEETLRQIAALAVERNLIVISDEIYEDYVFANHKHVSMATLPGMRERTISIYSLSKGYALTGVRIGYIVAPPDFTEAMLAFHHAMTICANSIAQYGAAAALSQPRDWFVPILQEYDRRRRLWMSMLDDSGVDYAEPQGAYYLAVDVRPTGLSSAEFSRRLRDEVKVVMGTAGEGFVRGSLMQASPQFEEGLERFSSFVKTL